MITLLVGLIILLYVRKNWSYDNELKCKILLGVAIVIIALAFLIPVDGYNEMVQVEQLELMPLRLEEQDGKQYYLRETIDEYIIAYDNSSEYDLNGGAYLERNLNRLNKIEVYESEECVTPILKKYEASPKRPWYSFAIFGSKVKYVIYIPMGSKLELN